MTEKNVRRDYNVFRMTDVDNNNSSSYRYVVRGPLGNSDESNERKCCRVSDLAKSVVDFHLAYLKNHDAIKENSDLNPFDCFDLNIIYKIPFDIRLMDDNVYEVNEFSLAEKNQFLESLKSRYHELWETD